MYYFFAFLFGRITLIFSIQNCFRVVNIAPYFFAGFSFVFKKIRIQETQSFLAVSLGDLLMKEEQKKPIQRTVILSAEFFLCLSYKLFTLQKAA